MDVLFPFGYGLSYTTFEYTNLKFDKLTMKDTDELMVSVDVTNTGNVTGKEVVQLYVAPKGGEIIRPVKELRGFDKVELKPDESKTVTFKLGKRAFAYWNTTIHNWHVETETYEIQIAKSAREVVLTNEVFVESTVSIPKVYSFNTRVGELLKDPKAQPVLASFKTSMGAQTSGLSDRESHGDISSEMMTAMMNDMPLRALLSFAPDVKKESLQQIIDMLNQQENYD